MKTTVSSVENGFVIRREAADGTAKSEVCEFDARPTDATIASLWQRQVREHGSLRLAAIGICAKVSENPRLDGYAGSGDLKTGKYAAELKSAWSEAETAYLREIYEANNPIPPMEAEPLKVAQVAREKGCQQFIRGITREDKNYSGVKTLCIKFFAFCGKRAGQGDKLVPAPVMTAMIAIALGNVVAKDDSLSARIRGIHEEFKELKERDPAETDAMIAACVDLLASLRAASVPTIATDDTDVTKRAKDAIEAAKAKPGKAKPETAKRATA